MRYGLINYRINNFVFNFLYTVEKYLLKTEITNMISREYKYLGYSGRILNIQELSALSEI